MQLNELRIAQPDRASRMRQGEAKFRVFVELIQVKAFELEAV